MSLSWRPGWNKGEIIRNVLTGKPYLVIHIFKVEMNETVTCVISLEEKHDLNSLYVITHSEYDRYVKDLEMEHDRNVVKWKYKALTL